MPTPVGKTNIFDYYKNVLIGSYREICGDITSYEHLDDVEFRAFIADRYNIKNFLLAPHWQDFARTAFIEYLAGGLRCPVQSFYKQSQSSGATMSVAARPEGSPSAVTVAAGMPSVMDEEEGRPTGEFFIPDEIAREIDSHVSGMSERPVPPPSSQTMVPPEDVQRALQDKAAAMGKAPSGLQDTAEMPLLPDPQQGQPPLPEPDATREMPVDESASTRLTAALERAHARQASPPPVTAPPPQFVPPAVPPFPVAPPPPSQPRPVPPPPPFGLAAASPPPVAPPPFPARPVSPPPTPAPPAATTSAPGDEVASTPTRILPLQDGEPGPAASSDGADLTATTSLPAQGAPEVPPPPAAPVGDDLRATVMRWTGAFPPALDSIQIIGPIASAPYTPPDAPPYPIPSVDTSALEELLAIEERISEPAPPPAIRGDRLVIIMPEEKTRMTGKTDPLQPDIKPARPVATPAASFTGGRTNGGRIASPGPSPEQIRASTPPPATDAQDPLLAWAKDIRTQAAKLAENIRKARRSSQLYRAWNTFKFVFMDQLHSLIAAINDNFSQNLSRRPAVLTPRQRGDMLSRINVTMLMADKAIAAAEEALDAARASPERALVAAQLGIIKEFRNHLVNLNKAINAGGKFIRVDTVRALSDLETAHGELNHPAFWMEKMLAHLRRAGKFSGRLKKISIANEGDPFSITFKNPQRVMELLDQTLMVAARWHFRRLNLSFEWNENKGTVTISSKKTLKKLRGNRAVRNLASELNAKWDMPGRIERFLRKRSAKMRAFGPPHDRLVIWGTKKGADARGSSRSQRSDPPAPTATPNGAATSGMRSELAYAPTATMPEMPDENKPRIAGFYPSSYFGPGMGVPAALNPAAGAPTNPVLSSAATPWYTSVLTFVMPNISFAPSPSLTPAFMPVG